MPNRNTVRFPFVLVLIFAGLVLAAMLIIHFSHQRGAESRRAMQFRELASLVDFKVQSLAAWLAERRANSLSASRVPAVADDLQAWLHEQDEKARARVEGFLYNLHAFYGFSSVELLLPDGQAVMAVGTVCGHRPEFEQQLASIQPATEAELVDLHLHEENGSVHMGFITPILMPGDKNTISGLLFFSIDAREDLYPLLQYWPERHSSLEIDLMRAEGTDIVYLSPMHEGSERLFAKRHVPAAPDILPGMVMAPDATPYQGMSMDYRNKKVLVAGQPVPGTPWHLLVKVDEDEIMQGVFQQRTRTLLQAVLALVTGLVLLYTFWQRQHLREVRVQAGLAAQLEKSEENYRALFSQSQLPSIVIDYVTGHIRNANHAALRYYGYSLDQMQRMKISEINILNPEEIHAEMARAITNEKNYFNFCHRLASGELRDVEVFSGPLNVANGNNDIFSVIVDVTERKELERKLMMLASTDALTGLPNRRHFLEKLQEYLNLFARGASSEGSLIMLDLDHFKVINDTWGHAAGDEVLQQVSGLMRGQLRKIDILGRIGGEEFAILLPGIGPREAWMTAERLRLAVAGSSRVLSDGTVINITISAGITGILDSDLDTRGPLARADHALYQAKEQGRNRSVTAS